ncbi:MAG: tyrosine-type recombinase/integrase [Pseudomonadales bacterium]
MAAPQPAQDGLQPALKFNTHQFIVLRMDNKRKINPLAMRLFDTKIADGPHRTPKGLRHGYGIHAVKCSVPITSVQTWMGHAQLSTTAIYLDFSGAEATELAARMWQ